MQHPLLTWSEVPRFRNPPPPPDPHVAAARVLLDLRALDLATFRHARGTARLTLALAHDLELGADAREHLVLAALLHDLGKLFVDPELLRAPGPLDEARRRAVRAHAVQGHAYAARVGELRPVAAVARHHHERWDGAGWPDGLAGAAIPWDARVVGLANAAEALAAGRDDRPRAPAAALAALRRGAGARFDPGLVRAASRGERFAAALAEVRLSAATSAPR